MKHNHSKVKEKEVDIKEVLVTPAQATIWLLKNLHNRPLSEHQVAFFVKRLTQDEWELTTDAIGFTKEGDLINGQHRLTAIVRADKPARLLVGFGFDKDAFNVIDTGKVRNAGDVLGVHGIGEGVPKSAIIRFVKALDKGYIPGNRSLKGGAENRLTNQDILDFAEKNKDLLNEAYKISLQTTKEFKGLSGRYVGGLYWIFSKIDRDSAQLFFHYLSTGVNLKADDPIYVLRKRLLAEITGKKRSPDIDKLAWTVMAWNATRKGSRMTKIIWLGDMANYPKPI